MRLFNRKHTVSLKKKYYKLISLWITSIELIFKANTLLGFTQLVSESCPNAPSSLTTKIMMLKRQRLCLFIGDKSRMTFVFRQGCRVTVPKPDSGLRLIRIKATSVSAVSEEPGWLPASWKVTEKGKSPSGQPWSGIITRQFIVTEPYSDYNSETVVLLQDGYAGDCEHEWIRTEHKSY